MSLDEGLLIPEEKPRLRSNLQIQPASLSGQKVLVFQDPERWSDEAIVLPAQLAPLLQYFDGSRTVSEIQEQIMRQTQQLVPTDNIRSLAHELDQHLLLDSERFRSYVAGVLKQWQENETRPAVLAGTSYPADPAELRKFLDDFYAADSGPGLPGENKSGRLKAIVAPHIELTGNGAVYAHAYKKLMEESQAELFIILGTGHFPMEDTLVFTEKNFETPLGVAETDREFIQGVRKRLKKRSRAGDFSHKREHSIELQVIFLQHLLAGKRNFKIVPVLVGSCATMLELGFSPEQDLQIQDYLNALAAQLRADGRKIAIIASADLAHLGPRYGDREGYTPIREEEIKTDDWRMLCCLEKCAPEAFFMEVARVKDARKICGIGPIYFTFKLVDPGRVEVLKWSAWYDANSRSAVSFCSMALY
jgi:hypothetical protein